VALGLDISDRPHLTKAIAGGEFVLSDYFMGTRDKTPLIIASMPQYNAAGEIDSVLLTTLDLNWLGQIASALTTRPGSAMLMIDGQGTVLASEPDPVWVGRGLGSHRLVQ
jgi:hypothetical protein